MTEIVRHRHAKQLSETPPISGDRCDFPDLCTEIPTENNQHEGSKQDEAYLP